MHSFAKAVSKVIVLLGACAYFLDATAALSAEGSFLEASHSPAVQVQNNGGAVLKNPTFMPITFLDSSVTTPDPWDAQLEKFVARFAQSDSWKKLLNQYGVQSASAALPVRVPYKFTLTPFSDDDVQSWLSKKLNDPAHTIGAPSESTIYTFFFPAKIYVSLSEEDIGCSGFMGYHKAFVDSVSKKRISYIVVPRCAEDKSVDDITKVISHEMQEAATDPYNSIGDPAYEMFDSNYATLGFGYELGDLCEVAQSALFTPTDVGNQIQQAWSNSAARAGNDPCNGLNPNSAYFSVDPVLKDTIQFPLDQLGSSVPVNGVSIPPGGTEKVDLHLFSSKATAAWNISIEQNPNDPTPMSFKLDKSSGVNGDTIQLIVSSNDTTESLVAQDESQGAIKEFHIVSELNGIKNIVRVYVLISVQ